MKKLLVLSAIAVLTACGGSDNKPVNDPSTNSGSTPAATPEAEAIPAAPADTSAAPVPAEAAKPGEPANK